MYIQRFPSGVRLNAADAIVGPNVLAGFNEPPETGPNMKIDPANAKPMANPAHDFSAFLSVAPNIVNTKIAVATTSAKSTAPTVKSAPGIVSPRYVSCAV